MKTERLERERKAWIVFAAAGMVVDALQFWTYPRAKHGAKVAEDMLTIYRKRWERD